VNFHGQTMYVDAAFAFTLQSTGTYLSEKLMTKIFTELVAEGMTVIDIGAYAGYYTLIAASAVGDKGKVFAFEPEPSNYSLMLKNVQLNNHRNVIPIQKAVTNITGTIKLFLAEDASGHSIVGSGRPSIMVESVTLDDYFSLTEQPIDIVKIDVEGAENAVLQGMRRIIAKNPGLKVFTEFSPEALRIVGCSPTEYLARLLNYGFNIYLINERKQSLESADIGYLLKTCESTGYVNLLCQRDKKELY